MPPMPGFGPAGAPMPGFAPGGAPGGPFGQGLAGPAGSDADVASKDIVGGILGGLLGNASHHEDPFGGLLGKMLGSQPLPSAAASRSVAVAESTGGAAADSETRIVTKTMPNGAVCTATLVLKNGRVQKNETRCVSPEDGPTHPADSPVDSEQQAKDPDSEQSYLEEDSLQRLQLAGMPGLSAGPMDDLWVLGGVFLERYLTAFDFDNARFGVAEPYADIKPELQVLNLNEARVIEVEPPTETLGKPAGWITWATLAASSLLVGAGALVAWRRSSHRRPQALASTSDLEAVE